MGYVADDNEEDGEGEEEDDDKPSLFPASTHSANWSTAPAAPFIRLSTMTVILIVFSWMAKLVTTTAIPFTEDWSIPVLLEEKWIGVFSAFVVCTPALLARS